jgi:hypothetical protein
MNFDGFKAHKVGDLTALIDEKMDQWLETRRIGLAEYDPDTQTIKLYVYAGQNTYNIDLDRCKTQRDLLDWLFHISGKTWCKGSVLTDFIQCLTWAIREKEDQDLWAYFKLRN